MRTRIWAIIRSLLERRRKHGLLTNKVQVDHLVADLINCASEMEQECKWMESDFLDIGERLQSIYHQASQLTQNARSAVEHIGLDRENNLLSEITRITHRAMADLDQEKTRIQESQKYIETIADQLLTIRGMIGGLKQITNTLKVVAININIESSRLAESRELFKAMPQEIHSLSDTMLEVVRTLSEETDIIATNLGAANQVMKRKLDHFHELVRNARVIVDSTTSDVTDLIDRSIKAFQYVDSEAQVLSQSVGEIVQGIQIHDNISQRIEHVAEALTDAGQNLTGANEKGNAVMLMDANLDLQHSQLKNILSDIDSTYRLSTQSFDRIGGTVENISVNIDDIVTTGEPERSIGQGMGNSIGSLNDALKKIQESINQGAETVAEAKEIVREATEVVARISGHMKQMLDVNFDIHLKSLNAIIGSIRLGDEGKSIGVLVEEMRDLAHRSNKIVSQVDRINTAITDDVSVLYKRIDGSECGDAGAAETDRANLESGIREFDAAGTAFIEDAGNVARSSSRLTRQVHTTTAKMRFLKSFADNIRKQLLHLDGLRTRLMPWIDTESGFEMLDKERLAARYTMQRERDIQTTVLTKASPEGGEPTSSMLPDDLTESLEAAAYEQDGYTTEECELGDNVELF